MGSQGSTFFTAFFCSLHWPSSFAGSKKSKVSIADMQCRADELRRFTAQVRTELRCSGMFSGLGGQGTRSSARRAHVPGLVHPTRTVLHVLAVHYVLVDTVG